MTPSNVDVDVLVKSFDVVAIPVTAREVVVAFVMLAFSAARSVDDETDAKRAEVVAFAAMKFATDVLPSVVEPVVKMFPAVK